MSMLNSFMQLANSVNKNLEGADKINIEELMTTEMGGAVDYGLWLETVEIQKELNDRVAPGWQLDVQQKKYNYWMAALDETVEVLNSRHWKWWKDGSKMNTVDWDNVTVEMIDLFHFILSMCVQHELEHIIFSQLVNFEINGYEKETRDDKFFEDFWNEFLMAVQLKNLPILAVRWVEYWYRIGGNVNRLFKEYRVKAALNNIRQEYGYGVKNNYHKMWPDIDNNNQLVEDNVIAWRIADGLELDKDMSQKIYQKLEEYYLKNVAI